MPKHLYLFLEKISSSFSLYFLNTFIYFKYSFIEYLTILMKYIL